jgi:hypothetical protein
MSKPDTGDEAHNVAEADDKPIVPVAVSGSIDEEVPAILRISGGGGAAAGSIWNRNESLYGGNDKVAAAMKKAIAKATASAMSGKAEPTAADPLAEPDTTTST